MRHLFLCVMGILIIAGHAAAQIVPRGSMFQRELSGPAKPADPAALIVTCTKPDGSELRVRGFWDGGERWIIRVMPDQPGMWRYRAAFDDGSVAAEGSFECRAPGSAPGMASGLVTRHAANPIWFGHRNGKPILIRGLHVGDRFFAANWPDAERKAFLDWAQANGYNLLSIASHHLNRNSAGRGKGWDTPDLYPINPAEWQRMEGILDDLAARGFIVYPFAGFFGRDSDFPRDSAEQEAYLRYAITRLGSYWNVLWNVGGPEPNLVNKSYLSDDDVHRVGRLIAKLDPYGHLLTVHNRTGVEPYRDSDWSTFGTVQGPKTKNRALLGAKMIEWHHPAKPLLAQETLWPGNKHHPDYALDDIRKNACVIHFSGASLVFGDMNGDSSSGFSGTMNLADRVQERHDVVRAVWDYLATTPFGDLTPRPDLVDRGHCLAAPGKHYMVYLPDGGAVSVKLEGGPYRVQWIDARDATRRDAAGETRDGRNLAPPSGGDDWILELTAIQRE